MQRPGLACASPPSILAHGVFTGQFSLWREVISSTVKIKKIKVWLSVAFNFEFAAKLKRHKVANYMCVNTWVM